MKLKSSSKTAPKSGNNKNSIKSPDNKKDNLYSLLWGGAGNAEIVLSEKLKLVVSISKNNETMETFLDVRSFVTTAKFTGLTSKGINVPLSKAGELLDLIDKGLNEI